MKRLAPKDSTNDRARSPLSSCHSQVDAHEECRESLRKLACELDAAQDEIRRLKLQVKALRRTLYGRRSERVSLESLGQLVLLSDVGCAPQEEVDAGKQAGAQDGPPSEPDQKSKPKKRRPNHHGRGELSSDLERRVVETIPLASNEQACKECGCALTVREKVTREEVEYIPERLVVHVTLCEHGFCRQCKGDARSATLGQDLGAPLCRAAPSLMAHLIEAKCDDSLPIHRQCERLARLGFMIPVNTLYGYWNESLDMLHGVALALQDEVLASPIVGVDDTGMLVVQATEKRKSAATQEPSAKIRVKGHLWCFLASNGAASFLFAKDWSASTVAPVFRKITGFIQCDDYKGYSSRVIEEGGARRELVRHAFRLGCGMHIRRKFEAALKLGDTRATPPMEALRELYAIEAEGRNLTPAERKILRDKKSIPILDRIEAWCDEQVAIIGKSTPLGQAICYARAQREYLRRCFSDGRFEIDNGRCERALRKPALGRKNVLFAGSLKGAERLATAYTLVMSCRALGISTREYLIDVIGQLRAGFPVCRVAELTPRRWAENRLATTQAL